MTPRVPAEPATQPARSLFWLALTALTLSIVTVIGMTIYSRATERWIEHTTLVYQTTRSARLDLDGPLPAASGIITRKDGSNPVQALARFDSVGDLTADNPPQQARARALRELAGQWASALRSGTTAVPRLAAAVDSKTQEFLAEEQRLYALRVNRFHRAQIATAITVTIELLVVGLIVFAYARRITRHIAAAHELQQRLEAHAAQVEKQTLELLIDRGLPIIHAGSERDRSPLTPARSPAPVPP